MPPRAKRSTSTPSQHSILLGLARQAKLFLTPEGQAHATIPATGNTVPLTNATFTDWLIIIARQNGYYPSFAQVGALLRQLEIDAHASGVKIPVTVRTAASAGNALNLDLTPNQAIQISAKRWTSTHSTARFRRPFCSLELPTPQRTKAPIQQLLQSTFNIAKLEAQTLATWLIFAMLPNTKAPALVITGKAAKEAVSTLRNIIDPVRCPINVRPTTQNQCGQMALINRIPAFSISHITEKGLASEPQPAAHRNRRKAPSGE